MQVSKWGNSLAIRLPASVVEALKIHEGDDIEVLIADERVFKVRKKRQWIASKYTIKLEMAVTNIDPGNPPQIKLNEKIKPNIIMSDQIFTYDPDFWGEYNTIAPESTLQEALEKIEKSMQEISEQ